MLVLAQKVAQGAYCCLNFFVKFKISLRRVSLGIKIVSNCHCIVVSLVFECLLEARGFNEFWQALIQPAQVIIAPFPEDTSSQLLSVRDVG